MGDVSHATDAKEIAKAPSTAFQRSAKSMPGMADYASGN
jgi:hypothetical protein